MNTTGTATTIRRSGRSPSTAQAANATSTTWRLPSTVARPAPTFAIEWCQVIRSAANRKPAATPIQWSRAGRGP